MKKRKYRPFAVLRHAVVMVSRTLRSYALLSVTITMSFTLLLGYLVYQDSQLYNKHKAILSYDSNVLCVSDKDQSERKLALLQQKAADLEQTYRYDCFITPITIHNIKLIEQESGKELRYGSTSIHSLSRGVFGLYDNLGKQMKVTWLPGQERDTVDLQPGEAILEDTWFYALGLDQQESPVYKLAISPVNGIKPEVWLNLRVIGFVECGANYGADMVQEVPGEEDFLETSYSPHIYVSVEEFGPDNAPEGFRWFQQVMFYTAHPYELASYAESIYGYNTGGFYSTVRRQDNALENIRSTNRLKVIIAGALLLLLGINLYSSFANALSSRKFEIGVKRALGASAWSIVRQFLYESFVVMVANVLLSICLVADIAIVYKYILQHIPDIWGQYHVYIIHFSPYSMAMFGVCAATLTIVFSIIFAYRSTQVQVVDYLKAE